MIAKDSIDRLVGSSANVIDSEGNKIGSLGELYLDDRTDEPSWATVKTGLFGMSESFVPLDNATTEGGDLRVPYTKDQIKDAPRVDPEGHLEVDEEERLYRHYGVAAGTAGHAGTAGYGGTGGNAHTGVGGTTGTANAVGTANAAGMADTTGTAGTTGMTDRDTTHAGADDAMTRSEERLRVGTESQEVGKVRLRKYVVTENVTRTVPVQHEEVRLVREPVTEANRGEALSGPDLTEAEHEVTLHAEKPVVDKETVPVERVRLGKETVSEQETVSADVRKEEIEADDDMQGRHRG